MKTVYSQELVVIPIKHYSVWINVVPVLEVQRLQPLVLVPCLHQNLIFFNHVRMEFLVLLDHHLLLSFIAIASRVEVAPRLEHAHSLPRVNNPLPTREHSLLALEPVLNNRSL